MRRCSSSSTPAARSTTTPNASTGRAATRPTTSPRTYRPMCQTLSASARTRNWGVVGWSMGGTCAVDLTVMHPELFSTFDDIAGDMGPNAGTKQQTIDRLFGGDANAWADLRPDHGDQQTRPLQGRFGLVRDLARMHPTQHKGGYGNPSGTGLGGQDAAGDPGRPDRCRQFAVQAGQRQRHRVRGRRAPGPATTGRSPPTCSPRRCRGWPARSAPRASRGSRCRAGGCPGPAGTPLQAATH